MKSNRGGKEKDVISGFPGWGIIFIILSVTMITFTGCLMPAKGTYFSPDVEMRYRVEESDTKDLVFIPVSDGNEITVILFDDENGSLIRMLLRIKAGVRFDIIDGLFVAKNYTNNSEVEFGDAELRKNELVRETTIQIDAVSKKELPDQFELYFPRFILGDQVIQINPIRYERKERIYLKGSAPW